MRFLSVLLLVTTLLVMPSHTWSHGDVRNARWGMSIEDVYKGEAEPPVFRGKELFLNIDFDVLIYDGFENDKKIRVIYAFNENALKMVVKEIEASEPEKAYRELVDEMLARYRRFNKVEVSLEKIRSIMGKYRNRKVPEEALQILEQPEVASGLAMFEDARSVIQIPFRERAAEDIIVVNFIEKEFWAELTLVSEASPEGEEEQP